MGYGHEGSFQLAKNYTNEKINNLPDNLNLPTKTLTFDGGIYSLPSDVVNGQFSDVVIKGVTRTNLLENAGDFENIGLWTLVTSAVGGTTALDNTKKLYGNNSLKFNLTGGNLSRYREITNLEVTKYYECTCYCFIESHTSGTFRIGVSDVGGGNSTLNTADTTIIGQWQRLKVKFTGRTSARISCLNGVATTGVAYFDGAMLREITQAEYNDANNVAPHYINSTKSTNSVRIKSVGKNVQDVPISDWVEPNQTTYEHFVRKNPDGTWAINPTGGSLVNSYFLQRISGSTSKGIKKNKLNVKKGRTYTVILYFPSGDNGKIWAPNDSAIAFFNSDDSFISESISVNPSTITNGISYFTFTSPNIEFDYAMLSKVRCSTSRTLLNIQVVDGTVLPSEYEQYKESSAIINLSEPLRSLPNGTKDEYCDGRF